MTTSWGDVLTSMDNPTPQEADPATDALLAMIPESHRGIAEPVMRGLFSQIHGQLGDENYAVFCRDLEGASRHYLAGNRDPARQLFAAYGLDIGMVEAMAGLPAIPPRNDPETGEPFLPI